MDCKYKWIGLFLIALVLGVITVGGADAACWDNDDTNQSACEATTGCYWSAKYDDVGNVRDPWCPFETGCCIERGCWDYWDQTNCESATDDLDCLWSTWSDWTSNTADTSGWCEELSCWKGEGTNSTYCETTLAAEGLSCKWSSDCSGPWELSCWDYTTAAECNAINGTEWGHCDWGGCYDQGCWDQFTSSDCTGLTGKDCVWNAQRSECYERGCWNYWTETDCTTNSCSWDSGGYYCYEPGCWDYDQSQTACENTTDDLNCEYDATNGWCFEMGCWSYGNEADCDGNYTSWANCTWSTYDQQYEDTATDGWCEEIGCWTFGDSTNCTAFQSKEGVNCTWEAGGGGYCWMDMSTMSCSNFTDEWECFDTMYCWWDPSGNGTCGEPAADIWETVWRPSCPMFKDDLTRCGYVTGCDNTSTTCANDNETYCANITDETFCNEIPMLPECCIWNGTNCTANYYDHKCHDNMQEPPEGAFYCEDTEAYTSQTLCNQIAGYPWYMPCTWENYSTVDSTDDRCVFDSTTAGVSTIDEIGNQQTCEQAGGEWQECLVCQSDNAVSTGWCEMKTSSGDAVESGGGAGTGGASCDASCAACEWDQYGGPWNSTEEASAACRNSALGYCEFDSSTSACEVPPEIEEGTAMDCDTDCMSCTYLGDSYAGEPQTECRNSDKGCIWVMPPGTEDPTLGYCTNEDTPTCMSQCSGCTTMGDCTEYGEGGSHACTWDPIGDECSLADAGGGSSEDCSNGMDDDGDSAVDCDDSNCMADPFCGGDYMSDCGKWGDAASCATDSDCLWLTDDWGGTGCRMAGEICFDFDNNWTGCQPWDTNGTCSWHNTSGGMCEGNHTLGHTCMNMNSTQCAAADACTWMEDWWCQENPTDSWCLGTESGHCEFKLWQCGGNWTLNGDADLCNANEFCNWTSDDWSAEGGYCDPICFNRGSGTCEDNVSTLSGVCEYVTGLCDPADWGGGGGGFIGGGFMGGEMYDCFQFDGNETACNLESECQYWTEPEPFCDVNFTVDCPRYSFDEGNCTAVAGCSWTGEPGGGGWCDNDMFECGWNATLNADSESCTANSNCAWISCHGPPWQDCGHYGTSGACTTAGCWWEPHCEPVCFSRENNTQGTCNGQAGCAWRAGWCDFKGMGMMFQGMMDFGGGMGGGFEIYLGSDSSGDTNDEADITGIMIDDPPESYILMTEINRIEDAAICNGKNTKMGMLGSGTNVTKFYWYLDTDGSETGGCARDDNSSLAGWEFKVKSESSRANGTTTTTSSIYRCESSAWVTADISLQPSPERACERSAGLIAIDRSDINGFAELVDMNAPIRIFAATANVTTGYNISNPADTIGPVYFNPAAMGFDFVDCMDPGNKMEPECQGFMDFGGFMKFEDCYPQSTAVDEDEDGLSDCNDPDCKGFWYCVENELGVEASDYVDKEAPTLKWFEVNEYHNAAFIMYDSDEPANGTIMFYDTDSTCTNASKLTQIHDPGTYSTTDFMPSYKNWHDGPIENDGGAHSLTAALSASTTYYFKIKMYDEAGNPALSACKNFTTRAGFDDCPDCVKKLKFDMPDGWDLLIDEDGDGAFNSTTESQFKCGGEEMASMSKEMNYSVEYDIAFQGDTLSGAIILDNATLTDNMDTSLGSTEIDEGSATEDTSGDTIGYIEFDSAAYDEVATGIRNKGCSIHVPRFTGDDCTALYHCDSINTSDTCVAMHTTSASVPVAANMTLAHADYCAWTIPECEFSAYASGLPESGTAESATGGGGGGAGADDEEAEAGEADITKKEPSGEAPTGEVVGEVAAKKTSALWYVLGALAVVALIGLGVYLYKKKGAGSA